MSAVYDTSRRRLGLSIQEAAELHGVADRSIRRWIDRDSVPDDALQALAALQDAMDAAVRQAVALAAEQSATRVALYRYRTAAAQAQSPHARTLPPGAHAMLIAWTAAALEAEGVTVDIVWAADDD